MTSSASPLSPARTVILSLAGLASAVAFAAAPKLPTVAQQVRSIEGVTEYRLANGLQVLLYPDQ
jgi:zinc protease